MTIGLCLSGGGAKGSFELGALRLLYDRGIRPDVISSTSVGSINAIKLAEGEDQAQPNRGLAGLEAIWASLQVNTDMYKEEPWLHDKDMDPRVRDYITGHSPGLGIKPDVSVASGDLNGVFNWANGVFFALFDGASLLKSLSLIRNARSVYNLDPIRAMLYSRVDLAAIADWAASGKKLRMGAVSLESGELRYISESGVMLNRDGSPLLWRGPLSPSCRVLKDGLNGLVAKLRSLHTDLSKAAPGEKPGIAEEIQSVAEDATRARSDFQACVAAQPRIPLTVDLREGVLASASMPAIFPTVRLGDENYTDAGLREIIPVRVAIDVGATILYIISASPLAMEGTWAGAYDGASMVDVLSRSLVDVTLNEIAGTDLSAAKDASDAFTIVPDVELHDATTIDPGLIQINRDYGYMRAADVLDRVPQDSPRWASATQIALTRLATWRAEIRRYGHEDPTNLPAGSGPPDVSRDVEIANGKGHLRELLKGRSDAGGPMPAGVSRWAETLELHPWSMSLNDAAFVVQDVPTSMVFKAPPVTATIAMRNMGATTWTSSHGYALGSQTPQDNATWGSTRIPLPADIPPGEVATFAISVTAPRPPGAVFQWRMVQDGREWFGAQSPATNVHVSEPAQCAGIRQKLRALELQIKSLHDQLSKAAPAERPDIAEQIQQAAAEAGSVRQTSNDLGCS